MPRVAELLRPPTPKPIVALVKPQFEVGREQVGKGGVVRDEAARRGAVDKVRTWATVHGFTPGHDVESPITGPAGNVEYLLLLHTGEPGEPAEPGEPDPDDPGDPGEPGEPGDPGDHATGGGP